VESPGPEIGAQKFGELFGDGPGVIQVRRPDGISLDQENNREQFGPRSTPCRPDHRPGRYLDYAARGLPALALDTGVGGDAESPFEESIISVIRSWGYELTPQVGTAGYRIDIGIHHPAYSGVYALGVECDGYQYHSSRTARDRDRLREKVLRGLGWHLHRIWGTAWYRDRHGEERKLRAAIEHAIAAPVHGLLSGADLPDETSRPLIETEPATFDAMPGWAVPYETAAVPRLPYWVDLADPGSRFTMNTAIHAVVNTEAPIHTSLLHQRLRDAWHIAAR
jgi:very-short-patch-repair endonuclease